MNYDEIVKKQEALETPIIDEKYLFVLSNKAVCYSQDNTSFKSAIIDIAQQTDTNTYLFLLALRAMRTNEEMIELYNTFSPTTITDVYKIQIESIVFGNTKASP